MPTQLSAEAESVIEKNGLTLSESERKCLQSMNNDGDRQARWVANPLMQFLIEQTLRSVGAGGGAVGSATTSTDSKPPAKPEPKKKEEPEPEEDVEIFNLFG
jgi:hypothetical protein